MIGRGLGFTRWYDRIPELSQAVRMMESAQPAQQRTIANIIVRSVQMHQLAQRSEHGVKKLGTEKVIGLMKSKGKRRWYDHDPVVHQAFNHLYLMDDTLRYEMAVKIIVSLKAMDEGSRKGLMEKELSSLVKAIFEKPISLLMENLSFSLQDQEDKDSIALETISSKMAPAKDSSEKRPEPEEPAAANAKSAVSAISNMHDGMKIIKAREDAS